MLRLNLLAADLARLGRRRRTPPRPCALALVLLAGVLVVIGTCCWLGALVVVIKFW